MVSHHLEVERKYELADLTVRGAPGVAWQFEKWSVDAPVVEELDATYFDTPLGQLGSHSVALRRRLGGYDEGWHIKFDVFGNRHEVAFDLEKDSEELPEGAQRFVQVLTGGQTLEPRVGLATHRTRTVIRDAGGRALAEICDDSVRSVDYVTGTERSWQEWEVELLEGAESNPDLAQSLFESVEKQLLLVGARPSSSPAKIARALGKDSEFERRLAEHTKQLGEPKDQDSQKSAEECNQAQPPAPAASIDLLAGIIQRYSITLGQADLLIRAGVPDSTHQGRVAARQLRSILTFMVLPYSRDKQASDLIREIALGLKTYASRLEQHRNGELILPMAQLGVARTGLLGESDLEEVARLGQEQTHAGLAKAMTYLDSPERSELQRLLQGLVSDIDGAVDIPQHRKKYVAKVARRLQKKLAKRGLAAIASWPSEHEDFAVSAAYDEGIHDMRKLAKATRYCLTACTEAGTDLEQDQETLLKSARLLQAELGKLTDELTFLDWLRTLWEGDAPAVKPFTVGCLAGRSEHVAENLRENVYSSVPRVVRKIKSLDL